MPLLIYCVYWHTLCNTIPESEECLKSGINKFMPWTWMQWLLHVWNMKMFCTKWQCYKLMLSYPSKQADEWRQLAFVSDQARYRKEKCFKNITQICQAEGIKLSSWDYFPLLLNWMFPESVHLPYKWDNTRLLLALWCLHHTWIQPAPSWGEDVKSYIYKLGVRIQQPSSRIIYP